MDRTLELLLDRAWHALFHLEFATSELGAKHQAPLEPAREEAEACMQAIANALIRI